MAFCKVLRSELALLEAQEAHAGFRHHWHLERDACARIEVRFKSTMDRKFKRGGWPPRGVRRPIGHWRRRNSASKNGGTASHRAARKKDDEAIHEQDGDHG